MLIPDISFDVGYISMTSSFFLTSEIEVKGREGVHGRKELRVKGSSYSKVA